MQKKLIFLISLLILTISIVSSQTTTEPSNSSAFKEFKEKTDSFVEKEILLSENKARIVRFLFGLKESTITLSLAVILTAIWIMFLIGLRSVMVLTPFPFFKGEISSWIMAIIINLLLALSGGMILAAKMVLDVGSLFGFLNTWSTGALIFSTALLVVTFILLRKLFTHMKRKAELEGIEEEGRKIGKDIAFTRGVRDPYGLSRT